ncbi:protein Dok-7-like isoform X2 [Lethenteron reissneri]|uniref:protein Dok-7-like isoform X2 n=1 Tax=Lethenteron reissneri TaxID=7753 RepID=UPI002AB675E4|nr:protein Dok-7-like isoform X2 [Lethenteron reissneri]
MDPIIAEGPVRVRDTKKWKSRWVVLSKPSPVADCLMLLAFKSRSERLKGARPRTCARLQDVCAVSTGLTLHSAAHVLAVSCPSLCLLLAFERRDVMSAWDARLRYSLGEAHSFAVTLAPGSRLEEGPGTLHCVNQTCALTRGAPPRLLARWNLPELRRYGAVPGGFVFEAGSRCGADLGGGGESRRSDSVNKETQELEMRLSLLSLASGDGSPASSLPSSSPLSSQPSLSEGRSTPSGLSDDASLPPAGSALSISTTTTTSSSSSSSYGEPRRAIAARPCAAADRDRAAGNPAGGRSQNDAAGASRLSRAQQLSSLESGIGSGSLDSSSRGSVASSSSSGSRCVAGAPRHPSPRPDASAGGNAAATSVDALVGDGIDGGGGAAGERSRGGGERDDGADERATLRDRDSPRDPTYSSPRPLVGQGCSCLRCCASAVAATASAAAAAASDDKSSTRHRCRADADRARPFLRRQPLAASSSLDVPPREAADSESPRAAAMLQTRSLSHDVPQSKMSAEEFDWLSLLANQEVRRGLEPRGVVGGGRAATLPSDGGAGDRSAARAAPGPYLTFEQWRRATLEPQRRPQRDDETGSVPSPLRIVERSVDPGDLQETNAGLRDAGLRDAGLRGAGAQGSDRASTLTPVTRL